MRSGVGGGAAFEEDFHLLADVDGHLIGLECIDDLQDASIDALGVHAGEGFFGDDVRIDADKLQREAKFGVALDDGLSGGVEVEAGDVVLVDIDANVEVGDVAEEHEGFVVWMRRRIRRGGR